MTLRFGLKLNPFVRCPHNGFGPFGIRNWPRCFWHSHHMLLGVPGGIAALHAGTRNALALAVVAMSTIVIAVANKYLWWNWQLLDDRRLIHFHRYLLDNPADFISDLLLAMLGTAAVLVVVTAGATHECRYPLAWLVAEYLTSTFNGT